MIAPCTVDYLYKGALLLDQTPDDLIKNEGETPCHISILRAGYSLGIIVVAPVGALYHTVAGIFNLTKSLFSSEEESLKKRSVIAVGTIFLLQDGPCGARLYGHSGSSTWVRCTLYFCLLYRGI